MALVTELHLHIASSPSLMGFITTVSLLAVVLQSGKDPVNISPVFSCVHSNDDILIKNTEKDAVVRKLSSRMTRGRKSKPNCRSC